MDSLKKLSLEHRFLIYKMLLLLFVLLTLMGFSTITGQPVPSAMDDDPW
jgi:hypothetical protein